MKCCDITAGQLRTLITIERQTRTSDGVGGVTTAWAEDPAGGVYAKVETLSGTERWESQRMQPGTFTRAIIRFRGDANGAPYYVPTDRVFIRGLEYGILAVWDIEMRQRWLQLELMLGKPS